MADRKERNYYEITMSTLQLVVAFVLVLACLLGAFLAGLRMGRSGGPELQVADAAFGEAGGGEHPGGAEGEIGEFDFFSEGEPQTAPPTPAEIAERANPETTLLEDVGGRDESPPEPPAPAPEPTPVPAAAPEPDAAPAETPAATRPDGASGLVIQVFSTDNYQQAQQVLERLRGGGLPAFLSPVEVNQRTMHRVRIGPYTERSRAEQVAQRVRQNYRLDTWITQGE